MSLNFDVISFRKVCDSHKDIIGGKAYGLYLLNFYGALVPPWFVVSTCGLDKLVKNDSMLSDLFKQLDSYIANNNGDCSIKNNKFCDLVEKIQQAILNVSDETILELIEAHYESIFNHSFEPNQLSHTSHLI